MRRRPETHLPARCCPLASRPFPVEEKRFSSPETAWVYYYTRLAARQRTAAQRLLYRAILVIGYTNADISSMDYCSVTAVITVLALVTGGPNGCSAPSPVSLSSIVACTYNDTGLEIAIRRNEIICNSYAYDKLTVLCLYDRCNESSCMQNTESVVLDIICRDGVAMGTNSEREHIAALEEGKTYHLKGFRIGEYNGVK